MDDRYVFPDDAPAAAAKMNSSDAALDAAVVVKCLDIDLDRGEVAVSESLGDATIPWSALLKQPEPYELTLPLIGGSGARAAKGYLVARIEPRALVEVRLLDAYRFAPRSGSGADAALPRPFACVTYDSAPAVAIAGEGVKKPKPPAKGKKDDDDDDEDPFQRRTRTVRRSAIPRTSSRRLLVSW